MSKNLFVRMAALFAGEMAAMTYLPSQRQGERLRVRGIILSTADIFAQGNERFDREKFYLASGLTAEGMLP
jgi:hypothetical protein